MQNEMRGVMALTGVRSELKQFIILEYFNLTPMSILWLISRFISRFKQNVFINRTSMVQLFELDNSVSFYYHFTKVFHFQQSNSPQH